MAATRLITMHQNKGKSVAKSLSDRTDYAKNGEKTTQKAISSLIRSDNPLNREKSHRRKRIRWAMKPPCDLPKAITLLS